MVFKEKNMRVHRYLMILTLFLIVSIVTIITSCEYDVAEPLWENPFVFSPSPTVSSMEPPNEAVPGVNNIVIHGEGFDGLTNENIFFEIPYTTTPNAEIVELTSTSITIRRPNLATDSAYFKINKFSDSTSAGFVVRYGPYKIDPVTEQYGSFLENLDLGGIAVDNAQNIYVAYANSVNSNVYKVTPSGDKTLLQTTTRLPASITLGSDGWIYLFSTNRLIERIHSETGEKEEWHRLATSRQIKTGAFDANGYLYVSGFKTDLFVIRPDSASNATNLYPTTGVDSIFSLKVYGEANIQYLYVAGGSPAGHFIWRHPIDTGGTLGPQEVVTNLGSFTSNVIRDFALSSDGKIFIATDGPNSFLINNPADGSSDYFYKNIVPPYAKFMCWGSENYLYMINGNTNADADLAETWTVYKVNMGTTGAN